MNQVATIATTRLSDWLAAGSAVIDAEGRLRNATNELRVAVETRMAIADAIQRAEAREDYAAAETDTINLIGQDRVVNKARHEVQIRINLLSRKRQYEHNAYLDFNEGYDQYLAFDNDEIEP
jgi:prophage DNA circulation protein